MAWDNSNFYYSLNCLTGPIVLVRRGVGDEFKTIPVDQIEEIYISDFTAAEFAFMDLVIVTKDEEIFCPAVVSESLSGNLERISVDRDKVKVTPRVF